MEVPGGEADGGEKQQAFGDPAGSRRDGPRAERGRRVITLTLEEPDPDREDGDVAADQRCERVRGFEGEAPPERELAGDRPYGRPGVGREIKVPMPKTRLTQLRLASASLGTSMPAAPAIAVRSPVSSSLCR